MPPRAKKHSHPLKRRLISHKKISRAGEVKKGTPPSYRMNVRGSVERERTSTTTTTTATRSTVVLRGRDKNRKEKGVAGEKGGRRKKQDFPGGLWSASTCCSQLKLIALAIPVSFGDTFRAQVRAFSCLAASANAHRGVAGPTWPRHFQLVRHTKNSRHKSLSRAFPFFFPFFPPLPASRHPLSPFYGFPVPAKRE